MFAKLKISSRILIVFIGLLLLALSSGLIYIRSNSHFAPNAFQYDNSYQFNPAERHFYFDELKNIQITRGFWSVDVIPSDSNYLKIKGDLNILNYHLIAEQTDTGINLSLSDAVIDDHLYEFIAELHTNSLENIHLKSFANMRTDSTNYDILNVKLEDESVLQIKDCEISELNFESYSTSTLETETCTIGKLSSSMYDSAFALIYSAESIVYNTQKGYSVLMSYDDNENMFSNVSDSLLQILGATPEYVQDLKWLSPFQKPLLFEGDELADSDSITYDYEYSKKPYLSSRRGGASGYYPYNNQSISFQNELFVKGIKNGIALGYSRGLLTSIIFSVYEIEDDDSLYSLIMEMLKERFYLSESLFSDSSYYRSEENEYIYLSYSLDDTTGNRCDLYVNRNRITGISNIQLMAWYFVWENYRYRHNKYHYYHLPFVSSTWR